MKKKTFIRRTDKKIDVEEATKNEEILFTQVSIIKMIIMELYV